LVNLGFTSWSLASDAQGRVVDQGTAYVDSAAFVLPGENRHVQRDTVDQERGHCFLKNAHHPFILHRIDSPRRWARSLVAQELCPKEDGPARDEIIGHLKQIFAERKTEKGRLALPENVSWREFRAFCLPGRKTAPEEQTQARVDVNLVGLD
jgi:hypothetical protein